MILPTKINKYELKSLLKSLLLISLGWLIVSCDKDDDNPTPQVTLEERFVRAAENYTKIVYASYEDSYNEAVKLQELIDDFVADPNEVNFSACKQQWLNSRIPYGQTEAYRFYGGPIDDDDGPEGLINAWPMDENFIDYVEGDPDAGLINDPVTYPEITKQVLTDLNEAISEESIFTGYHAIEFLLWGQDFYSGSPGQRPFTDYIDGGTAQNQDRRGQYLQMVAELLVDNLSAVLAEWETIGSYRQQFLAADNRDILNKIFTSLGELSKGELAGERMFVAVDSEDQENEHSCFSDNTIADIQLNFQGIVNVYTGFYSRIDGSVISGESYAAIANEVDSEKGAAAIDAVQLAAEKIAAIPDPFDQAIINEQTKVLEAVAALQDMSDRLVDVGFALQNQ